MVPCRDVVQAPFEQVRHTHSSCLPGTAGVGSSGKKPCGAADIWDI